MSLRDRLMALMPEEPNFEALPVTLAPGTPPLFGAVLILAGIGLPVLIGGILGLIWAFAAVPEGFGWIVAVFVLLPLLAIPWGWWLMKSRSRLVIGPETVSFTRETPMGTGGWSEPLGAYRALVYRREMPPSGVSDRRAYDVLMLEHPREERSVKLMNIRDEALVRMVQERLAQLTGLPAEQG